MRHHSETAIFWLTAASASASLVSIAAMEILMAAAGLLWLYTRSSIKWPPYTLPLLAFMATTLISLANSSNPSVGWHPIQKFVLFFMGLLAVAFVTTESRARAAYKLLIATASAAGVMGIIQFVFKAYRSTGQFADDPTLLDRITGPLGHWMTFSGVQLLVWCASVPALIVLGPRWIPSVTIIGTAIVLSNTRGAWLGAAAGFAFVALALPRRVLGAVLIPMIAVTLLASPFIIRRLTMSFDKSLATNYSRAIYREVGMKMIQAHPLVGVGPERVHDDFPRYYPNQPLDQFYTGHLHNNFLQIAAERGLLCLAAFLWFLVALYRSLLRRLRNTDDDSRWVILGSLAALTGFVIAGLNEYNFGDSEVLVLFLFIVSIPFGLTSHVQEDPHSQQG
jgi:putative inorganic carbon (HCO3(-)) transporter